jgi:hypothetical protein
MPDHGDKHKNWFARHKILTVVIAFVIIGIIGSAASSSDTPSSTVASSKSSDSKSPSSNSSTPAPAPSSTPKIGQAANDGKFSFTITAFKCGQTQLENDNEFETATAHGQFCVMKMTIKDIGTVSQDYDDSSQYVYAADGTQYSADNDGSTAANPSSSQCAQLPTINPGVSVDCAVAFDVPKGVTPSYAMLHDNAASNGVKVSLVQ